MHKQLMHNGVVDTLYCKYLLGIDRLFEELSKQTLTLEELWHFMC